MKQTSRTGASDDATVLSIAHLSKAFTGTLALDRVDFDLKAGEIHALLGQNGAGKSTLIKILAGVYKPDSGDIYLHGARVRPTVDKLPINFIHQDLGLVDTMSIAENVGIVTGYARRGGLIDWRETYRAAGRALQSMGCDIDPDTPTQALTSAEKSIVAIARALATKCSILVLDEPTAALPEADVGRLFAALEHLRERGLGIIYVSHRLDEVFRLADRVTVLRDGRKIATTAVGSTTPDRLVAMIVGHDLLESQLADLRQGDAPALVVDELRSGSAGPVSFSVLPGETLGLVGLRGAGHDIIARALFGDRPIDAGAITLHGSKLAPRTPEQAMAAGIGFISSKRGEESMAAALSVRENLYLNPTLTGAKMTQWMGVAAERQRCADVLAQYSVRPPDTDRPIATLSGGNQQKVIVARWLEGTVRLLVLEEPTTGVDVGSKAEIYALMRQSQANGLAVLLVSSDFEEVATVCHRAIVFDRGHAVAEIPRAELTVSRLTALASGGDDVESAA